SINSPPLDELVEPDQDEYSQKCHQLAEILTQMDSIVTEMQNYVSRGDIVEASDSKYLINIMGRFTNLRDSLSKMNHDKVKRTLEMNGVTASDQEIEVMIEQNDFAIVDSLAEISKKQETLQKLVEMEQEFHQLESKLTQLYDTFLELNLMIVEQQECIDRVELNVCQAQDYVISADAQIVKAAKYKISASKRKIYIAISILPQTSGT
ncbi:hypothetical protein MXB_2310, partial [Myxobolus squamalis]